LIHSIGIVSVGNLYTGRQRCSRDATFFFIDQVVTLDKRLGTQIA
jgi:hypothetical protein